MAIYRLKSKLFGVTTHQQLQIQVPRLRTRRGSNYKTTPLNQPRQGRGNGSRRGNSYGAGIKEGQRRSQSTIDSLNNQVNDLTAKNTGLTNQINTANKNVTDLTNQVNSLTETNQQLQEQPGLGTGLALGIGGSVAGMVGLGKYRQKKEEEQYQQLEDPNQVY